MKATGPYRPSPRLRAVDESRGSAERLRVLAAELARDLTDRLVADAHVPEAAGLSASDSAAHRARVDRLLGEMLDDRARRALGSGAPVLDTHEEADVRRMVLNQVVGLGALEELLSEPGVQNIHITGDRTRVDYGGGRREFRDPVTGSDEELVGLVQRVASRSPGGERRFDAASPILSMELEDGSRLSAIMAGVALRPVVTIRRHPDVHLTLDDLAGSGMIDEAARELLVAAVGARLNILIAGATNAGKTTLLRALARGIDPDERIITIEDSLELGLERDADAHPDCVVLRGRPPNIEGVGEVTLADLVRASLRMCPDRVIVGETRGPETLALLNAMSMGTDGSMATIHASSSQQVFVKLAAYCAQSPERLSAEATSRLVASAVHLVVHIDTTPEGGRMVASIREVAGAEGEQVVSNELYARDAVTGDVLAACPPSSSIARRLARHGYSSAHTIAGWA